jgi:hypothetical protein
MNTTFKHTQNIKSIEIDNETLAKEIGDLYYDSLAEFLTALSKKLALDGDADAARGRKKLASHLHEAAKHIAEASVHMDKAWDICAPFVKEWSDENGSNRA